ncbi:radical SAM protein [Nonomuraea sp. H19]|uniref:radical SAM protein n=1 Tax=Nonomuraea sp. H19 TaxID=3452206 RepID=UPI003F89AAEE
MTQTLRWSPTAHFVEGPGATAVLNSLYLKPVYLGPDFARLKHLHATGAAPRESLDHLNVPAPARDDLARALIDARVLLEPGSVMTTTDEVAGTVKADRHLTELYLVVTGACNFSCSHCLSGSDETTSTFFKTAMDEKTAIRSVELFASVMDPDRANRVVFYGGEPLLRWPLMQLVMDEVRAHPRFGRGPGQIHTKVITNGSLLTARMAEELGRNKAEVVLSFDGPDWLTQLSRPSRTKNAYPQLNQLVDLLTAGGVEPSLSITVTEPTLDHLEVILEWVTNEVTIPVVFCILKQQEDLLYTDVFAERASDAMIAAYRRILAFGGEEQRLSRMLACVRDNIPYVQSCYAQGAHQIVVDQNGRVGVCQGFLEDSKFFHANVWQPNLASRLFDTPAMKHWEDRIPVNIDPCRGCASVGICGGGCPASASKGGKTIYDIDLGHCRQSKKVLPFLLWEVLNVPELRDRFALPAYETFGLDA